MNNDWTFWQAALEDPKEVGKSLQISEAYPQAGYYRVRYGKTKPFEGVALWQDEDGWNALRNGKPVAEVESLWVSCCRHPVTHSQYLDHEKTGRWHDDDAVVAEQAKAESIGWVDQSETRFVKNAESAEIGDNSGEVSTAEVLKDQIDAMIKSAAAYKKINSDELASKALSARNRLNELGGEAEKAHKVEKEPHLKAGKAVDKKWLPMAKEAKETAIVVRDALSAWETKKLQERRKAEAEQERLRAEVAKSTVDAQQPSLGIDTPAEPEIAPAETTGRISGAYGKSASVKAKLAVKAVTDWQALAVYMSAHVELQTLLKALAQRALDAGRTEIPGVEIEEVANVR